MYMLMQPPTLPRSAPAMRSAKELIMIQPWAGVRPQSTAVCFDWPTHHVTKEVLQR